MTTTRRDIVSGTVLGAAALGLYLYVSAFPVREGQSPAISPGFYPQMLAFFLGTLALIQIGTALRDVWKRRSLPTAAPSDTHMAPLWKDRRSLGLLLFTTAVLILYPFLMRILGFTITGLLFLGSLITALSAGHRRGRNGLLIVGITIAIGVLTYVVFRRFLNIPFPTGVLFRP
ncbi:MAG: tripartite tricarboxylate transporter TctB family protein [Spirochaeta sp.]|jgi:hypothetical protein|nr:tripartite tricarboxylate transporter TctB family protein [Spirochaeta sp.]